MNIHNRLIENNRILTYEMVALRIEHHLKEVEEYEIGDDYLLYKYRNYYYYYIVYNQYLTLKIDSTIYYLIDDVSSVTFHLNQYLLEIKIIDNLNIGYETEVIFYVK